MSLDHLFGTFQISASGLAAERYRMSVIANNLANANTTAVSRDAAGRAVPFRRDVAVFEQVLRGQAARGDPDALGGVRVVGTAKSTVPFTTVYRPGHPHAKDGWLRMPNVNPVSEMVDLITASRAYQSNLTVLTTFKSMMEQTLRLGR